MEHRADMEARRAVLATLLVLVLGVTACTGDESSDGRLDVDTAGAPVPGLSLDNEVVLVRAAPEPNTSDFVWTHAYHVGGLPAMSVGRPGPSFWEAAHREPDPSFVCSGGGGGYGCGPLDDRAPLVGGVNFGGPFVVAWSWVGVPDEAAAVQFTDQAGTVTWQRPLDGVVIFPHTIPNDDTWECECRFDALSAAGEVLVAVDVGAAQYVSVP